MKKLIYFLLFLVSLSLVSAIQIFPSATRPVENISLYQINVLFLSCSETWTCSDWSSCSGNTQSRTCTDSQNCGTENNKPALSQSCVEQEAGDSGSPSTTPDCSQGIITYRCECGGTRYSSGYCFNDTYYTEDPTAIEEPEEDVIESPTDFGYNFTIFSEKYSFGLKEDFNITVKTFRYGNPILASKVHVKVFRNNVLINEYDLDKIDTGVYRLDFSNNLEEGTYDFLFSSRFGVIIIEQSKEVRISNQSELYNIIREPTGRTKPAIYFIIITAIILILIFVVIAIRRKKEWKKK